MTNIYSLDDSKDGTKNAQSLACDASHQRMSYAACLWRLGVINKQLNPPAGQAPIKVPADWEVCKNAVKCSNCNAVKMRVEEVKAGEPIYFKPRQGLRLIDGSQPLTLRQEMTASMRERVKEAAAEAPAARPAPVLHPAKATPVIDLASSLSTADANTTLTESELGQANSVSADCDLAPENETPMQRAIRMAKSSAATTTA